MPRMNYDGRVDTSGRVLQVTGRDQQGAPAIVEYDVAELAGQPLAQYIRLKDRILNARRKRYYERVIFDPAATIPANLEYRVFDRGANSGLPAIYANTGANTGDPMTLWHTNLTGRGGEFPRDATVIIHELDVRITILNTRVAYTNGITTDPTVVAETNYSGTALMDMLLTNLRLQFFRGDQPMEAGFLSEWHASTSKIASFGGDVNEGFIANAWPGDGNGKFDRVKVFEQGDSTFHAVLTNPSAKALTLPTGVFVRLNVGLRVREIGTIYA